MWVWTVVRLCVRRAVDWRPAQGLTPSLAQSWDWLDRWINGWMDGVLQNIWFWVWFPTLTFARWLATIIQRYVKKIYHLLKPRHNPVFPIIFYFLHQAHQGKHLHLAVVLSHSTSSGCDMFVLFSAVQISSKRDAPTAVSVPIFVFQRGATCRRMLTIRQMLEITACLRQGCWVLTQLRPDPAKQHSGRISRSDDSPRSRRWSISCEFLSEPKERCVSIFMSLLL